MDMQKCLGEHKGQLSMEQNLLFRLNQSYWRAKSQASSFGLLRLEWNHPISQVSNRHIWR